MNENKDQSNFLRALLSMEKTYTNVWDSAHGLFGIIEKQFCTDKVGAKKFLEMIQDRYNILQIGKATTFSYSDIYMDGLTYQFFNENKSFKKEHFSTRMRRNLTTETNTYQIIHTNNKRKSIYHYKPTSAEAPPLSNENMIFFNGIYQSLTGHNPKFLPIPTIEVSFKRVILYSKRRSERINVDYDIQITDHKSAKNIPIALDNLVVIESKSMDGPSNRLKKNIKKVGGKDISHLSKFIVGETLLHKHDLPKKLKRKFKKCVFSIKNQKHVE